MVGVRSTSADASSIQTESLLVKICMSTSATLDNGRAAGLVLTKLGDSTRETGHVQSFLS